jgi:hypothetical protein
VKQSQRAFELLTDPDLFRQNSNINTGIVTVLDEIELDQAYCYKVRDLLWPPDENGDPTYDGPEHPAEVLLPGLSDWSRGDALKGSEQLVRSFLGQANDAGQMRQAMAPDLTPGRAPAPPQTVAVVGYQSAKSLQKDIRRKRWKV